MAASHHGEDLHVRTLQAVFRRAALSQNLLACGTDGAPLDELTRVRLARDGEAPGPIRHMCSGFHAASILLSRHAGWSLEDYWHPDHPSQAAVRSAVARCFGVVPDDLVTAGDDCGVLTYAFPLVEVARAYALLGRSPRRGPDPRRAALAPIADPRPRRDGRRARARRRRTRQPDDLAHEGRRRARSSPSPGAESLEGDRLPAVGRQRRRRGWPWPPRSTMATDAIGRWRRPSSMPWPSSVRSTIAPCGRWQPSPGPSARDAHGDVVARCRPGLRAGAHLASWSRPPRRCSASRTRTACSASVGKRRWPRSRPPTGDSRSASTRTHRTPTAPASWPPRTPTSCCATRSAVVSGIASTRRVPCAAELDHCPRHDGAAADRSAPRGPTAPAASRLPRSRRRPAGVRCDLRAERPTATRRQLDVDRRGCAVVGGRRLPEGASAIALVERAAGADRPLRPTPADPAPTRRAMPPHRVGRRTPRRADGPRPSASPDAAAPPRAADGQPPRVRRLLALERCRLVVGLAGVLPPAGAEMPSGAARPEHAALDDAGRSPATAALRSTATRSGRPARRRRQRPRPTAMRRPPRPTRLAARRQTDRTASPRLGAALAALFRRRAALPPERG